MSRELCQALGLGCLQTGQGTGHVTTGLREMPAHEQTPQNIVPLLRAGRASRTVSDRCSVRPASNGLTPLLCCLQTRQSAVYEMTGQQDVPEQKLDMMLVVGGFNSSNTSHLQVGTQGCQPLQGPPHLPLQAGCRQPLALSSALPATPGD